MKFSKGKVIYSIITVVYNSVNTLEATLLSVLNQKSDLFEYWVIDGGSTDGSLDIIRKYENKLTGWISEPDKGIYDAMNKGIDRSNGQWIYFLGGDDELMPNILENVFSCLDSQYSMIYGEVMFSNKHQMRSFLGARTLLQNTVHHQSAFYNKNVFSQFRYDPMLKVLSDYELNLKLYIEKAPTLYIPYVISTCAVGGASSEFRYSLKETNEVRSRFIKSKGKNTLLSLALSVYYAQKRLRFSIYGHRV